MRLTFDRFDGRGHNFVDVIDRDTGKKVGYVYSRGVGYGMGGICVSLFDDKYQGSFNTYVGCKAFVKGVEVVLNHMTIAMTGLQEEISTDSKAA